MNVVFLKFDEYKTGFINSYNEMNYESYDETCYKLYMLYIENIIINMNINTETQLRELDEVYKVVVSRFNNDSFYKYLEYHRDVKLNKLHWDWFVMSDFTSFNALCSDVAKIIMNTYGLANKSQKEIELFDFRDLYKQQPIVYWNSKIIPSNQSHYWNN